MKNTSGSSRFDVLLKHLFGGSERFRQNFVKIASATVLAQILGLLSLPILSRLFSSTDFGILTTYMMVQGISLALVTGRVDWLIPNVKRKRHAQRLISMGVMISLVMVVVIAAIFMGFEAHILAHLHLEEHALILWLVPLGLIAGSLQLLFQSWYVFRGNLGTVGWSKLAQAVVTLVLSLIFGVLALTGNGLVIAYIAGFFAAAFVLIRKNPEALPSFTFKKMKIYSKLLRIYFLQLLSLTGLSLTNIAMTMSLTFLILTFYGTQVLGWYGLVFRIATAPIGLITTALVQSFWTDAAILAKSNPVQLRQFYLKTLARLSMLSIPLGILFLCGPLYIPFIFGEKEWSGAGILLTAVTPYLIGMIIFSPTTHLIVYGKSHWQLMCDLLTLCGSVIVFSLLATSGSPAWQAILGASTVMFAGYILRFIIHLRANTIQIMKHNISISSQPAQSMET